MEWDPPRADRVEPRVESGNGIESETGIRTGIGIGIGTGIGTGTEARAERPRRLRERKLARPLAAAARSPWLAALAIGVPLALLVALQLHTLARLEDASVVAHRATLRGYGKAVLRPIEDLYRGLAQTALAAPPGPLDADALAAHFAAQDARGVRRWFALAFTGEDDLAPRLFAPDGTPLAAAPDPGELHAIRVAAAPWQVVASDGAALESPDPIVAEQDREHRLILRPVLDARARVIGVLGLVIDEAWVRDHLLPEQIEAERGFFPDSLRDQVVAELRPRSDPTAPPPDDAVEVGFKFVFADQALAVRGRYDTPEQWARRSAGIQLALSLAAAGALGGAVLLALRNAARATRLSRMKTEFVSNVSHELRTPLASIRMFGELLRLGRVADPEKVRAYGESIEAESRRLTRLVDNILDFAKIESDQKRYRFEPTDLAALVEETLEAFAVRVRQDGVALALHAPARPLPPVRLDPGAIEQVLTNLLDNAVKHGAGGRRVDVTLGRDGPWATVAVADQGPGIPPDEHERIFEQFYRVGDGLVHDAPGSGLGLAIVKHVVEAHRGSVSVDSRPGAGATFTIRLPIDGA